MGDGPSHFEWTSHARVKAEREAWVPADVERAVAEHHSKRERNAHSADWRLRVGRLVVVYDWPLDDYRHTARIVSLWRRPR